MSHGAKLGRRTLLAGIAFGVVTPARADPAWSIAPGREPASLRVTNGANAPLRLERIMSIQGLFQGEWLTIASTEMVPDVACPASGSVGKPSCVALRPRETIETPPWVYACGSCQMGCRASADLGEGPLRFVVRACGGGAAMISEPFRMPRAPG